MEKMLLDAQHESGRSSSRGSSQCNRFGGGLEKGNHSLCFSYVLFNTACQEVLFQTCVLSDQHFPYVLLVSSLLHNSPLRAQTPLLMWRGSEGNSSQSDEDFQERRREVENLMKKNADWIWDWSSRPENNPPKEFLLKYPKRSTSLSIRNTSVMKKGGVLSADFLKLFLPSLIISHILAVGLG